MNRDIRHLRVCTHRLAQSKRGGCDAQPKSGGSSEQGMLECPPGQENSRQRLPADDLVTRHTA